MKKIPVSERFWCHVDQSGGPDACWPWLKACQKKGMCYGIVGVSGACQLAHRVAYTLHHGSIPDKQIVCHSCDNPPCCNPNHLFLGTHKTNSDDKIAKKRWRGWKPKLGTSNPNAKITNATVIEIRNLLTKGELQRVVGAKFGLRQSTVSRIANRKLWPHL